MSLKFWTSLQTLKQAVYVVDGKIVKSIPRNPPKTIFRRCGPCAEYDGKLAIGKHASFELWDKTGSECFRSFHHPMIYAPHWMEQYGEDILICSSGLEMFFLMDIDGNVKWEWWGYKNGLGERNHFYFQDQIEWIRLQTTSDTATPATEDRAHFNSIFLMGDKFLAGALYQKKVIEITVGKQGFKLISDIPDPSCHTPFYGPDGALIYGTEKGLRVGDRKVLEQYEWVKTARSFEDGFVFTHHQGMVITDGDWNVKEEIPLPMPFGFIYLERT